MLELAKSIGPTLVGALAALVGVYLGPWLNERSEKKRRRSEKFEDLVAILHEHRHWLDMCKDVKAWGEDKPLGVSPLARGQAIAIVYFPQLVAGIKELDTAATQYEFGVLSAGAKRLNGNLTEVGPTVIKAAEPYMKRFGTLMMELSDFGAREFR